MSLQKDVFLEAEGDAWLNRNAVALEKRDWQEDAVCKKIATLFPDRQARILEIGCGEGSRLQYLARTYGHAVSGIEPSAAAVAKACERGVSAVQGTADQLPFADQSFDVVIFGFCLYLCDDAHLFTIAREGDRVLSNHGWLLILDFDVPAPVYKPYHHRAGIQSRKMDYKSLFLWHPAYTLASYDKFHHGTGQWTDEVDEWVSLACLRKSLRK